MIGVRNKIIGSIYRKVLKPYLFLFDPEKVHDSFTLIGGLMGSNKIGKVFTGLLFNYKNNKLKQTIRGISFPNPVGLAAGFDKNAQLVDILPAVGFGFVEVGSITALPCKGNAKPRLWRLKKSNGLVVYYGLKNDGAEKIAKKLKSKKTAIPLGISIAKTNCLETADTQKGIDDYVESYKIFSDIGDYITINISCPNAYGGLPFTDRESLSRLLTEIGKVKKTKPIFIKMAPDLSDKQLDEIIEVSQKHEIDGFICVNLTKDRENKSIMNKIKDKDLPSVGGISGKVVEELSNQLIAKVYKKTNGKAVVIGCGGIFSAEDAYKKIKLGSSLLQLITGMIFQGPQLVSEINEGLVKLLKKDGYTHISEAIGKDNPL